MELVVFLFVLVLNPSTRFGERERREGKERGKERDGEGEMERDGERGRERQKE